MSKAQNNHHYFMQQAFKGAEKSYNKGEVPVGAVTVKDGKIIAHAHNLKESKQLPHAHAEMLVIEKTAKKLGSWRLLEVTLYCTLEPCPMCAGVMLQSRIKKLVYGAPDLRWGAAETFYSLLDDNRFNHKIEVDKGLMKEEVEQLMKKFFKEIRNNK